MSQLTPRPYASQPHFSRIVEAKAKIFIVQHYLISKMFRFGLKAFKTTAVFWTYYFNDIPASKPNALFRRSIILITLGWLVDYAFLAYNTLSQKYNVYKMIKLFYSLSVRWLNAVISSFSLPCIRCNFVFRSRVCRNRNKVHDTATNATSSLVLQQKINSYIYKNKWVILFINQRYS